MPLTKDEYKSKHGQWAEVYTRVLPDGTNVTIAIRELVAAIRAANLKPELVPIDGKQVDLMVKNNAVSIPKLVELGELTAHGRPMEPIIVCIGDDGLAIIVDGHHRFVLSFAMGQKRIGAFICYPALWQQFLITDMEPLTKEQLKAAPHPSQFNPSPWKQNQ
jgi:hypothetical protein